MFELDFLEEFDIHRNHNNVFNSDFAISPLSDCSKTYIKPIFTRFYFQFQDLYLFFPSAFSLVNLFNFLQFCWSLFLTLGSSDKLCIKTEFFISLCTENGMLNATETTVCTFFHFYWHPISFLTNFLYFCLTTCICFLCLLGFLVTFISSSVVSAFTSAAAITIAVTQLSVCISFKHFAILFLYLC